MHVCRLAQFVGPGILYQDYIGPRESIPAGWSIVTRRSVRQTFPATPAADTNPCVDAVGGGTFEQGDAA